MIDLQYFLNFEFWSNTGKDYFISLIILVIGIILLKVFQSIFLYRLRKLAEKTKTEIDDVIIDFVSQVKPAIYFVVSLFVAIKYLSIPEKIDKIVNGVFLVIITVQSLTIIQRFIDFIVKKVILSSSEKEDSKDHIKRNETSIQYISIFIKIAFWILAMLIILSNFGINVTSLIAGLGIGGLAIALALQSILKDIFSSFSIILDKPFEVGDHIKIGNDDGTVEKIGIKTTRLKTLQGEELVISNTELTSARVNNFKKLNERRVVFLIGVAYETPTSKLKKIPAIVKKIIKNEKNVTADRVFFKEFGDFSLLYEIVYYMKVPDYSDYVKAHNSINLEIKSVFEKEGIVFAYPTQTIYLNKE